MFSEEVEWSLSGLNADGRGGSRAVNSVVEALVELPHIKTDQVEGELMLIDLVNGEEYRVWDQEYEQNNQPFREQ